MTTRGQRIGCDWRAPALFGALLLAACARSTPAPVEYRETRSAPPTPRQVVQVLAPLPQFKPAPPAAEVARAPVTVVRRYQPPVAAAAPPLPQPPPVVATTPPPSQRVATTVAPPLPAAKPTRLAALTSGHDGVTPGLAPPPRRHAFFAWPVNGPVLSSFGPKPGGQRNDGINIAAAEGVPVRAAESGIVAYVGNELRGFGNLVLVRHADGWMTAYAHIDDVQVERGQLVRRGQVLARVGHSGQVDRPQLHFEVRRGGDAVDPARYLAPAGAPQRAVSRDVRPYDRPVLG